MPCSILAHVKASAISFSLQLVLITGVMRSYMLNLLNIANTILLDNIAIFFNINIYVEEILAATNQQQIIFITFIQEGVIELEGVAEGSLGVRRKGEMTIDLTVDLDECYSSTLWLD
ncbi:hypothetical protein ACJX0J_017386 [Zea mays]